jgi:Holliday junction resolvase RusA-like endonuclease
MAYYSKAKGKHMARAYDSGTAEGWKALIAASLQSSLPAQPYEGPVSVSAKFLMPRPKRLQRRKDPPGELPHTAKPDGDNLVKAVLDVCSQINVWRDDAQVVDTFIQKRYAAKDGRPGLHLIIQSMEEE